VEGGVLESASIKAVKKERCKRRKEGKKERRKKLLTETIALDSITGKICC
jgi:hypothetical protein